MPYTTYTALRPPLACIFGISRLHYFYFKVHREGRRELPSLPHTDYLSTETQLARRGAQAGVRRRAW